MTHKAYDLMSCLQSGHKELCLNHGSMHALWYLCMHGRSRSCCPAVKPSKHIIHCAAACVDGVWHSPCVVPEPAALLLPLPSAVTVTVLAFKVSVPTPLFGELSWCCIEAPLSKPPNISAPPAAILRASSRSSGGRPRSNTSEELCGRIGRGCPPAPAASEACLLSA